MHAHVKAFLQTLFDELGARRRRMRESFGDRGQSLVDFLVLGGLFFGSAGLLLKPWMAGATPWGFAVPLVFLVGFVLLEARRQRAPAPSVEIEGANGHDWIVLIWSLGCALAGAAAFMIALGAEPAPPPEPPSWQPPAEGITELNLDESPPAPQGH
jgi:hypothetical protein